MKLGTVHEILVFYNQRSPKTSSLSVELNAFIFTLLILLSVFFMTVGVAGLARIFESELSFREPAAKPVLVFCVAYAAFWSVWACGVSADALIQENYSAGFSLSVGLLLFFLSIGALFCIFGLRS